MCDAGIGDECNVAGPGSSDGAPADADNANRWVRESEVGRCSQIDGNRKSVRSSMLIGQRERVVRF